MHTGPQTPTPQPPSGPGGGRGGALLVGGIAFALVFLLIVGVTVGYLVLRSSSGPTTDGATTTSETVTSASASPSTTEPEEETTEPGEETGGPDAETGAPDAETGEAVAEERCWTPEHERSSENPSGRLRGGGLQFIPPSGFDIRNTGTWVNFLTDSQSAAATVEGTWVSTLIVGRIAWQPGVEYPGDEAAAERLVDCLYANGYIWGDTSQRSLHDEITEPVTVAGMSGYQHRAVIKFGQHDLTRTDSTEIVATVVDTPDGPSAFVSEIAVGVTEHEEAADEAFASLTGV